MKTRMILQYSDISIVADVTSYTKLENKHHFIGVKQMGSASFLRVGFSH